MLGFDIELSEDVPTYLEVKEECAYCLGKGTYDAGIIVETCTQCDGKGYIKVTKKITKKENNVLNTLINAALEDEKVQQTLIEKVKKVINDISFTPDEVGRIKTAVVKKIILAIKDKLENKLEEEDLELDEGDLFGN